VTTYELRTHARACLLASIAVTLIALGACNSSPHVGKPPALSTAPAPWHDPDHVPDRVAAAGLKGGGSELLTVHYHSHLDIFVNGASEPVAASIGREHQSFFSPLHTHATSGLIHIEAAKNQQMTLGMLFTEWGVRLTDQCIGAYCAPATPIATYVNGQPHSGAPAGIVLRKGEEIAVVIGTPPASIPSAWDCKARIDAHLENPAQCADFG
jgi:hypothetical protein